MTPAKHPYFNGLLEYARFKEWQRSNQPAHFFLDSVDEAKIRLQTDFYAALDKVCGTIGPRARERACMVITSRVSEWQPESDRRELMSRFGTVRPKQYGDRNSKTTQSHESLVEATVVQIEALDRAQVRTFAEGCGITQSDEFLSALDAHFAWEFVRRPVDVLDLVEFWKSKGRLGNLTEIIEHDITSKLRETTRRGRDFVLSEARARDGAESLAAGTVLCKKLQFKVPDDNFVAPNALDATRCLPADWQPEEVAALLSRALFDSVSYGHIRFHHRRVAEYLAAQWFRRRMTAGCPTHVLQRQLFDAFEDRIVPRSSLIPVTAWLCDGSERWNEQVRDWTLQSAPEIHLEYGDPEALPLEFRKRILQAWIKWNEGRTEVWLSTSHDNLKRLADARLSADISRLLEDHSISDDVRAGLLQIVRYGALIDCLESVLSLLAGESESDTLRLYAMSALRDMGTLDSRKRAWAILCPANRLSDGICAVACEALYPVVIDAVEFASLLRKSTKESQRNIFLAGTVERHLEEQVSRWQAGSMLSELNGLLQESPHISVSGSETRISSRFEWILDVLPKVLLTLLSKSSITNAERDVGAQSFALLAESQDFHHQQNETIKSLNAASTAHEDLRRRCFWQSVSRWRAEFPGRKPSVHRIFDYGTLLEASASDVKWLISDIEAAEDLADKEVASHIALQLGAARCRNTAKRLQRTLRDDNNLSAILRAAQSDERWLWLRRLRYRYFNTAQWRHNWRRWRYSIPSVWQAVRFRCSLRCHLNALRTGKAVGWIAFLCHEAEETGVKWAPVKWKRVTSQYGPRIADAARDGCKRFWRNYTPQLPHEKASSEMDPGTIIGLAGISAAIDDGDLKLEAIGPEDARLATRYAVNEMNGFTDWLPTVASKRPEEVTDIFAACVLGEWDRAADKQPVVSVMANLYWEGGPLARLVHPTLLQKLRVGDPPSPEMRLYAVSICLKHEPLPDQKLGEVAALRCRELPVDSEAFPFWSAIALQLDAARSIDVLVQRVNECDAPDKVVAEICSLLTGESKNRFPLIVRPSFESPPAIGRLIPLVYHYIRPIDDIDRARQGPYSPTVRDQAQRFRNSLLTRLARSEDPRATEVLLNMQSDPALSQHQDWICHLLDERVKKDADFVPWNEEDIRLFPKEYETDPKTDLELFAIVVNRLVDIKNDVERSDNSLREEVAPGSQEAVLRRWLARKLKERSRDRYTIPQEEEIDQRQRPDLRAENSKTNPISIEIKWADSWTIPELLLGLESQLVGQYLRAHDARYGIYLLGKQRGGRTWETNDRDRLHFREVVDIVTARAREIVREQQGVNDLRVIAIDFQTPPGS